MQGIITFHFLPEQIGVYATCCAIYAIDFTTESHRHCTYSLTPRAEADLVYALSDRVRILNEISKSAIFHPLCTVDL
jgi:hypothetical protein